MPEKFKIIPGGEILDKVVEGVLWVGHLVTQRHVNPGISDHHFEVHPPEPETLNRWTDMGEYFDQPVPDIAGKDILPPATEHIIHPDGYVE